MNIAPKKVSGVMALLAAATVWAQTPQTQGSAGAAAQGAVSAQSNPRSVATTADGSAQASGGASGPGGQTGAALADGSSVNAVLSKPLDSGRSKPGDPVSARTTQNARTEDGILIPAGSQLTGHIARATGDAGGAAGSSLAIVFDRALMKDGHEVPLRGVAIRSLAAGQSEAGAATGDGYAGMGAAGGMAGGVRGGLGGGLAGRATGAVGGTAGAAVSGAGSMAGTGMRTLQPGPGATGGLDASGMLTAQSVGVFGLRGVSLDNGEFTSATGSIVSSDGKRLRLEQGTRLLLTSSVGIGGRETPGSKNPEARPDRTGPDRR